MHRSAEAYAKINMTLDILGKREDGYHLLKMIMQSVSLFDTVTVWNTNSGRITLASTWDDLPCDERNTAHRAARAFFEATGIHNSGLAIKLKKRIPFGAGLGGGSADAAAVIKLLDAIYETELSGTALAEIGGKVGADVPFCLTGGTMLAEGTGNILSPLPDLEKGYFVLVKPSAHVSTAEAYGRWEEMDALRRPDTERAVEAIFAHDLPLLGQTLRNVFEEIVPVEEREEIKDIMKAHKALGAVMSGSGSAIFGLFDEKPAAEACKKRLEDDFSQVFLCRPVAQGILLK